jgi:hypothetical protein
MSAGHEFARLALNPQIFEDGEDAAQEVGFLPGPSLGQFHASMPSIKVGVQSVPQDLMVDETPDDVSGPVRPYGSHPLVDVDATAVRRSRWHVGQNDLDPSLSGQGLGCEGEHLTLGLVFLHSYLL